MSIDMSQFFEVFFDETDELLAEKEKMLLAVDLSAPDMEDIDAIFRAAHSIKGGAATFGLNDMTEVTHILENLLDMIRKREIDMTAEHVDAFLTSKDILVMQRDGHRHGSDVDQAAVADILARLNHLYDQAKNAKKYEIFDDPIIPEIHSEPEIALEDGERIIRIGFPNATNQDLSALEEELTLLGKVEIKQATDENEQTEFILISSESLEDVLAICSFIVDPDDLTVQEEFENKSVEDQNIVTEYLQEPLVEAPPSKVADSAVEKQVTTLAKPSSEKAAATQESTSIRVSVEKVDQLINLVGELVITQAMVEQRSSDLDPMVYERLLSSVSQLARNTRDLQEAVMSIRMMPMDYVFSRFPRMVRDIAQKLGKKIDFVTQGAATELDKGLIERIIDPLTHLVRNSLDHGIEMPEIREAAGKNPTGKLMLSAAHQGGNIVIEVTDDGGGLNRERILSKAKQNGLPVSENMSDSDVWQLIFAPGFSTAETVTDVSGRGVGMDVVRRNIAAMGGVIDIQSAQGIGSKISISLPLTLAILDGMSIKVGEEVYILPLNFVVESLKPRVEDVKEIVGKGRVVKVRGEYLPLISLYQLFNITPKFAHPSDGIIVIIETDGLKAALFIDEMLGQQQVVVKNLESNYRKVHGISGATILGDGGVSLILDVSALVRTSRTQQF